MLTDKDIQEFQAIYQKHFGIALNRDEAALLAEEMLRLVRFVYESNNKKVS